MPYSYWKICDGKTFSVLKFSLRKLKFGIHGGDLMWWKIIYYFKMQENEKVMKIKFCGLTRFFFCY